MKNITSDSGTNDKGDIQYVPSLYETTLTDGATSLQVEKPTLSHIPTTEEKIYKELENLYAPISSTGETETMVGPSTKKIIELLDSAIGLLDEVLEVYDEEMERMNTFSLFEEKIKALWELRDKANQNFSDVLVLLEVAVKNSHYQNYEEKQYQVIKTVLEKIKGVHITPQQIKECRELLMSNGIDLFAPIRNWESYTVEIKKHDATE